MALTAEQIAEARSEGYSDAEILDHYAKTTGADITAARKEGYTNAEILGHLSGSEVSPQEEAASTEKSALTDPALSGALGAGAGAAYSLKTVPIKMASAFGNAIAKRIPQQTPTTQAPAPGPNVYTTPSGIPVEQTPGGLHPGAVGNAQFNVEQQQANALRQNMAPGFEQRGTSRIMTPVGMEEPAAAPSTTRGSSILSQKRAEGWPIVREVSEAVKSPVQTAKKVIPAVTSAVKGAVPHITPMSGAIGGYNLQEGRNRELAGDELGAKIGYTGAASQVLPKFKGKAALIKPVVGLGAAAINKLRGEPESVMNKAEGGVVAPHLEHQQKMAAGGAVQKFGAGKLVEKFIPKESVTKRMSEALSGDIGKFLRPTQADRMKSTGGDLGGIGFSKFGNEDPRYAGAAWGVNSQGAATRIGNLAAEKGVENTLWVPMIGSKTQHHSNQHVHDTLVDEYERAIRMGKLPPELRQAANQRLQTQYINKEKIPLFGADTDIGNPEWLRGAGTTFEKRAALGDVMGGKGIGGRKGTPIDYEGIITEYTDPATFGVPTHSLGNRLFTLTGENEFRPDLHSAFPYIKKGQDRGVILESMPQFETGMADWYNKFLQTHGGRKPGFFDKTLGSKQIGYPIQEITEPYLESLYKAGYAEGGRTKVNKLKSGLSMLPMAQRTDMRNIGQTVDEFANADAYNKAKMLYNSPAAQAALIGGSMVNPAMAVGVGGSEILKALESGDYGDAALYGGLSSLPFIGKGVQAAKKVPAMIRGIGQTPSMPTGMVPAMAGGGSTIKKMMNEVMQAYGPKAAKEITPGAPHTYPPKATGPWMQDYVPEQSPIPKITYMGKYTKEPYYSSPEAKQAIMSAAERQRMQYLQRIADPNSPGNTLQDLMQQYPYYESWMK